MKLRYILAALVILAGILLIAGCTDKTKDNPTRPETPTSGLPFLNNFSFYSIFFSTANDPGYMVSTAYVPPGYDWSSSSGRPYPVLYLLSPFRGDERYYFEHGLAEVADRLLQAGKIQPMIIVTVDGRSVFGGSYFTNSTAQGNYMTAMVKDTSFLIDDYSNPDAIPVPIRNETQLLKSDGLINRMDDWYLTVDDPKARGIGGVGIGGYGAFSLALRTGMFGSVSAVNAPLDFDGLDGNTGFVSLLDDVRNRFIWRDTLGIDSIIQVTPDSADTIYDLLAVHPDTSFADPEMSLVVSTGAALSPHWTGFTIDAVFDDQFGSQTFSYTPTDSLTGDRATLLPQHMIHIPIDSTGKRDIGLIWDTWLQNNIPVLYQNDPFGYAADFLDMPKLLVKSEQAEFYYDEQMDGFIDFLSGIGDTNYTVMDFKGNSLLAGSADHFLYDILEDILIFHSENLEIPDVIEGE